VMALALQFRHAMTNDGKAPRRIALTGGPGAGKTAVLELARRLLCEHVHVLPEAASLLFRGGFPRAPEESHRQAEQRAIFYVQRELEATADNAGAYIVLCDRGTVDGGAYWPGHGDLWSSVGTTLDEQLARYDAVIHLGTPIAGYNHANPLRVETVAQARAIDDRIAALWSSHPRRFEIPAEADFLSKAAHAIQILREQLPAECRAHLPVFEHPR
jgi:predicted ATPase